ncbi:STM4015 family protein [Limnoglobus roseus]|uniref:TIGR02996 domain-containing protein n=1 Tax=Limnoglobus roseus TaxID=2598579 RepID=A0A5C1AI78_9BACT|nr:STM4015 family protein [Limnoglobus roseus]QEL17963.1 TIGR02996 domain-containing protein [Limnoglobus roseus]
MGISKLTKTFAGRPVRGFDPDAKPSRANCVYRIAVEFEDDEQTFPDLLDAFLTAHGGPGLTALVVGSWDSDSPLDSSTEVVESLIGARGRMPNLTALFLGDVTAEECEISWMGHGDLSPLLPAFPKLEEFRIRGTSDLTFGTLKHANLKSLAVESGGLPAELIDEVAAAKLPKLEHLELWLGTSNYGGINTVAPLKKLLAGKKFPHLSYLGLKNSAIADAVAAAVAKSPLLDRLDTLDLSLGNLSDDGAKALIAAPAVKKLKKLDLNHHYISDPVLRELRKLKVKLDVRDRKKEDRYDDEVYRYITASE